MNLYLLNEIVTNNFNFNFLTVISVASVACGILVIINKNPIVSVLFLIGLFITISGYLMMMGINFIALSYLLVYVGAVSILFLFILMLINVRISELVTDNTNSIPLAIMISLFANTGQLFPGSVVMPVSMIGGSSLTEKNHVDFKGSIEPYMGLNTDNINTSYNLKELLLATSHSWDMKLSETFHITSIGNVMYTNYPMWLILTSIILLLAMIGSILITIKQ